jgi:hypothetical protein
MSLIARSLLAAAAGRLFSIARRLWLPLMIGFLVLAALTLWAAISAAGWLAGMMRDGIDAAPAAARTVIEQVDKNVPSAAVVMDSLRTLGQPEVAREVSGTDPAPVERFPGLTRVEWQRDGELIKVRYEGEADIAAVLAHYASGFSAKGYRQEMLAATRDEERHDYLRGDERIGLSVARQGNERVSVLLQVPASRPAA